jgi:thioredoxin 2
MSNAFHVVCPDCDRINRIPLDRPAQAAKCGQCGAKLFRGAPIELSGERFRRHLARNDSPVVVDFWAAWCGPCRAMAPAFERAAQVLEPRARLVKINVDAEPQLAAEFDVQGIPALLLIKQGQVAARHAGVMDFTSLCRWVEQAAGTTKAP